MGHLRILDHLVLAILVAEPIFWLRYWPRCVRASRDGEPGARAGIYRKVTIPLWLATFAVLAAWIVDRRSWSALRLRPSDAWWRLGIGFLLAAIVVAFLVWQARKVRTALARPKAAAQLREKLAFAGPLIPQTRGERRGFWFVSLTAGICEEILFRGFLLWLISAWLGVVAGVILSSVIFGCAHIYLGASQVPRTALVGLALALLVVASGSLWPAILIHAAIDLSSGEIGFLVGRAGPLTDTSPLPA